MRTSRIALALAIAFPSVPPVVAQTQEPLVAGDAPVKMLGIVTVSSGQPTSLPTQIPTTIEGVTRAQIEETINATDAEDALKYFPSLLVRRRYIGDYNHAVLSSRASGTGNSARSAVYADGILLSNYLGNGASYTPRWGMVTPEEIERVDVMYGPFSAAYPGNSVGAVVDYVTRMPTQLEGHVKATAFSQPFSMYNTSETYTGNQASASLGSKSGDWSWWIDVNHTDSAGQPQVFATKAISAAAAGANPVVTGAVYGLDKTNTPWYILGTNTQYHTVQDHAKLKLAYDFSPTVRASYILTNWSNKSDGMPQTYLRSTTGAPVYGGSVVIHGNTYSLNNTFNASRETQSHWMHGMSVKSHTKGVWDWELAASQYDYGTDLARSATINTAANLTGVMGSSNTATVTDQKGTGWTTAVAKGTWRPGGTGGHHIVDFGAQQENYQLHTNVGNISATGNWMTDAASSLKTDVGGKTQTRALYAQDTWAFAPKWKTVLGARLENWTANGGYAKTTTLTDSYDSRDESFVSPKAALAYQWSSDLVVKGSLGRAVRMPTVAELYGATSTCASLVVNTCPAGRTLLNDHSLKPEKSWTTELSLEKDVGNGLLRVTVFNEDVNDSLYSQTLGATTSGGVASIVQNIDAIKTVGLELAFQGNDNLIRGLDLTGSITYADSRITNNTGYVAVAGDTIGKYQPRVPVWRASALANYRWSEKLNTSIGVRYSGDQYSTLNNSDINGFAYTAASRFTVIDVRVRYAFHRKLVGALGIDNLTNEEYWNFHPYPKRTVSAEIKYDF